MAFVHGKNSSLKIDKADGVLTDISPYTDSCTGLPGGVATGDTSTFGSSAETSIPGLKTATKVSIGGKYKGDATQISTILDGLYNAGGALASGGSISIEWGPGSTTAGLPKFTAESWLTDYKVDSKVKDVVTWSAELEVTGGVTAGVFP